MPASNSIPELDDIDPDSRTPLWRVKGGGGGVVRSITAQDRTDERFARLFKGETHVWHTPPDTMSHGVFSDDPAGPFQADDLEPANPAARGFVIREARPRPRDDRWA